MRFDNCNLFKRSFTTQGIGYTFNNEIEENIISREYRNPHFSPNINRHPSLMKYTNIHHTLTVIIDNNAEEVDKYENIVGSESAGEMIHKLKDISVSLHNPKEPADNNFIPTTSVQISLGS